MQSKATTVKEYLAELPPDRRAAISAVRKVILENLPEGYEEGMEYGMIGYFIPLKRYPVTYNGQPLGIAALASQKNYMSVYLMNVYGKEASAYYDLHQGLRFLERGTNRPEAVTCPKNDTIVEELEEFAAAVRGEGRPEMDGEAGTRSLAVLRMYP